MIRDVVSVALIVLAIVALVSVADRGAGAWLAQLITTALVIAAALTPIAFVVYCVIEGP